jgi:phenylalanyl-tRNA synthetase beta chain
MICDTREGMCIAGVFGGVHSGVTEATKNIFLESACFDPVSIRKTSFRHGLRTDAASRFEKGTDISATLNVLKRAARLITEICGGEISSSFIDVYPDPKPKNEVSVKWHFIKKLSGKSYHPESVKEILGSLGFDILKEGIDELQVAVPYHKPDISLPADIVEEILRIDGLDNIDIPGAITLTPSVEEHYEQEQYREKISQYLVGLGFNEMMTNSITNAAYFSETEQATMVRMLNSLSAELNILRNSLLETALEVVAHNLNHKNLSFRLFEFGKSYSSSGPGKFQEDEKCCLVVTGNKQEGDWQQKPKGADIHYLKGVVENILKMAGIKPDSEEPLPVAKLDDHLVYKFNNQVIAGLGEVKSSVLEKFGIRQPVFFAGMNWQYIAELASRKPDPFRELSRFPAVQRDLALLLLKDKPWNEVEQSIRRLRIPTLQEIRLFDVFESEKLGADKKSIAVNFTFLDKEKTLTDKEIDGWMQSIMESLEKDLQAEIRK